MRIVCSIDVVDIGGVGVRGGLEKPCCAFGMRQSFVDAFCCIRDVDGYGVRCSRHLVCDAGDSAPSIREDEHCCLKVEIPDHQVYITDVDVSIAPLKMGDQSRGVFWKRTSS